MESRIFELTRAIDDLIKSYGFVDLQLLTEGLSLEAKQCCVKYCQEQKYNIGAYPDWN